MAPCLPTETPAPSAAGPRVIDVIWDDAPRRASQRALTMSALRHRLNRLESKQPPPSWPPHVRAQAGDRGREPVRTAGSNAVRAVPRLLLVHTYGHNGLCRGQELEMPISRATALQRGSPLRSSKRMRIAFQPVDSIGAKRYNGVSRCCDGSCAEPGDVWRGQHAFPQGRLNCVAQYGPEITRRP
jgi:hypothetical protein